MKEIGAMLKAAREENGLSLEDLQMLTKIRAPQLEAMEAGDFHKLPGEVYVRGFIISYAKNVGLDPEPLLAEYYAMKKQAVLEEADPGADAGAEETASAGRVVARKSLARTNPGLKKANLLVMASVGLVVVAGLAIGKYYAGKPATMATMENGPVTVTEEQAATAPVNPPSAAGPAENQDRTEATVTEERETAAAPVLPAGKGHLVVEAREVVWLGLYQLPARTIIFEGTLQPGERHEWFPTADVYLRIGNAGGIRVFYNGEDLGVLGSSGQVVTKVLPAD